MRTHGHETAQAIAARLNDLSAALLWHGLQVTTEPRRGLLRARNAAAESASDPRGRAMNPGLSQTVALTVHADESLHWHWLWDGPTRDSPMESEHLCPAEDVDLAASRITRVLSAGAP